MKLLQTSFLALSISTILLLTGCSSNTTVASTHIPKKTHVENKSSSAHHTQHHVKKSASISATAPKPVVKTNALATQKSNVKSVKPTAVLLLTQSQIRAQFWPKFKALRISYQGKLQLMLHQAVGQFQQDKSKNSFLAIADLKSIYQQYVTKAYTAQNQCQNQFNQLISQMQTELLANHLPMTLVSEAHAQYYQTIAADKASLLQKVRTDIGL